MRNPACKFALILFLSLCFLIGNMACRKKIDPNEQRRALIMNKLQSCAKLASVEYVVKKIIIARKTKKFLGLTLDRPASFLAETKAIIKAGIDLKKLKVEDIKIDRTNISITMPPIEIVDFSYPVSNFNIISQYTHNSLISKLNLSQKDQLFQQGEIYIWNNISRLGIIKTAETNLRNMLTKLFKAMKFNLIDIQISENKTLNDKAEETEEQIRNFEKGINEGGVR